MIKQIKLRNGLRVVKISQKDTAAITVMLMVPVGSRMETTKINGISHFLEHLMFKGTKRRPSTLDISKALDGVGAEYNAYTSKDHTAYYIKIAAEHLELALDLFSDMLFNSLFDPKEIQRERGVILEEINMYEDNPLMHVETLMEMSVFGKNHPLGFDIAGPRKNIRKIPRTAFMRFKKLYYTPGKMHLVLAGRLPRNVNQLTQKYFSKQRGAGKTIDYKKFKVTQTKPQFLHMYKDTQQTQISIGFPALPYDHMQLPALAVLSTVLGGNMSSRLFIRIRERQGLCYVIRCSVSPYLDTGVLSIQAGLDKSRLDDAFPAILSELKRIKEEPVTAEELTNAKEFIKGQTALGLEDSSTVASWYGKQSVLTGKLISPTVKMKTIDKVTKSDVQTIAQIVLNNKYMNIGSIGPYRSIKHLAKFINI